ncbi:hybrid sensor histidine kinase/response regulator [Brevundimonas vancanneytii]|uniref:histidine kinase n=1 Tax=Brevundimonas vancanneytii TaxID=1325724 RepID=A0A4P1JS68_9CAUL|nr:hybrid sensor histidine kinase/response regulator [Brevundimonas vancanneytii]VTO10975.1 Aerobic respiration control sensor protein ArcB [Brevundimonas vancanneytii]
MEFVLLAIALGLAAGVAGVRLSLGAHGRIRAVQRLHDGQAAAARRRITDLEDAVCDVEARLLRVQAIEAAGRRTHTALLAAFSREMRGPLDAILGFADLLRINAVNEPLSRRQGQAVDQIREGATRLQTLVEGLTAFTEDSGVGAARERLDPLLVARRICQSLAGQAEAAGVDLRPPPFQAGLTVQAEARALDQVMTRLIRNAVQHNRPGGTVVIEGRRVAQEVWITVRDTGPGLSPGRIETLFDPFARRGRAASSVDGAGVGLAAARRLATAMDGDLTVESQEGEGAAFILRLPASPQSEPQAALHAALPLPRLPQAVLLYIAEDAAAVALMRHLLQGLGSIQLHVAATGQEGADLARDLRPDAVILDLDLHGGQGLAVKAALAQEPLTRDLPVMALSAAIAPDEVRRAQAAGFAEYLIKPIGLADLTAGLSRLLAPSDAPSRTVPKTAQA